MVELSLLLLFPPAFAAQENHDSCQFTVQDLAGTWYEGQSSRGTIVICTAGLTEVLTGTISPA